MPLLPPTTKKSKRRPSRPLSTVDSEFGRTTDPVRMYMREMGSVELLTREGEIEIAKRIEEGLKHMIQAISACPTTIVDILDMAAKVETDEMRIDELVDGLIDPNAIEEAPAAEMPEADEDEEDEGDEEGEGGGGAASASPAAAEGRCTRALQDHQGHPCQDARRRCPARAHRTRPTPSCCSNCPTS